MIRWSASRIDAANYCRMRYYLKYVEHERSLQLSIYEKGSLLHELIENFWPSLGSQEQVMKKKKKFFDRESFAKYSQGKWMQRVIAAESMGRSVEWRFKDEKWAIYSALPNICSRLFDKVVEEGPPAYSELPFDFVLGKMRFKGKIDEVRLRDGRVVIRDYKSGRPWVGAMKLNHDPQLTFYNIGLCSLCHKDKEVAKSLGLEGKVDRFMGNTMFINPDFEEELFMIEDCSIHTTMRRDEHFFELLKMIKGMEDAVKDGDIYPERGRKCDDCDMKKPCENRLEEAKKVIPEDGKGQFFFSFAAPAYKKPVDVNPKKLQRKINWKRKRPY